MADVPNAARAAPPSVLKLFSREPLHDPTSAPPGGAADEVRTTPCDRCACRCGIRVHLRDGEVRYIDGNPNHPLNQGVICAKGASGVMKQRSPARLTRPLLRKPGAERGAGDFEAISWERALDILVERLARYAERRARSGAPGSSSRFPGTKPSRSWSRDSLT